MTKPRYISEPLKTSVRAMLDTPRTIYEVAEAVGVSKHHVRYCLDAIGAVKAGKRTSSGVVGRPFDLWGMP